MRKIIYYLMFFALLSIVSCSEDGPDSESIFVDDTMERTQFDKWLDHYFIAPYNIKWEYRMLDAESDLGYFLVPADYLPSVKFAIAFKHVILEGYDEVWGNTYNTKAYFPKYFYIVGNYAYNNNGTTVLGTAEAGIKISFYGVNNYVFDNIKIDDDYEDAIVRRFKTAHHEFTHSMHQQIPFSDDFRIISLTDYIEDDWNNKTLEDALDNGFITTYARKNANEDFAELYSWYVTYSAAWWEARVAQASDEGKAKINQKLSILRTYMKNNWDLDLDEVRNITLSRISELNSIDLTDIEIK
ncbi:zinc-binding metallopeptidase [Proteiniphilum sp. UBA5384]|uniref:zinc-binding metallopeptidase n=1 Tax=Proteiniphilum sp. UBA5384 TaxID=1947279 RepID=UPI0025E42C77|nr:putative zinc-binding metallopeptidase [Proteiniphilum sp. UBA5384]